MEISEIHHLFLSSKGVCTDSRKSVKNKLFFALKGENFDGNKFVENAIDNGAKLAVSDEGALVSDNPRLVLVKDVLSTLQKLATYHRNYLGLPLIAITGSNGKTTTKELMANILQKKISLAYTKGNFNNHIGVPLTLLSMTKNHEMALVEMGASHQREIEALCKIARPDYGYITNFGKAHLEGFGGVEGVIKGKSELYGFLIQHGKKIFINADDPLQVEQSKGGQCISFSEKGIGDYQIKFQAAEPFVEVGFGGVDIKSHLIGDYNAKNIAAAISVGSYFGVSPKNIKQAVESYMPDNNRSQILKKGSNEIILDAYNANPTSMRLALENFKKYPATKKTVILGDMFEIGETALKEHQEIVDLLGELDFEKAFVCGDNFSKTKSKVVKKFKTFDSLKNEISQLDFDRATILVKGSRGMALERLTKLL